MNNVKIIILRELKKNPSGYISGEMLSKKLKMSRSAIWKYIEELRQGGYRIDACQNRGYRLSGEPDFLDLELMKRKGIYYQETVESTNLTARKLAENGAGNFTVIAADKQLSGRGRHGRNWHSPKHKGLWFTIILRPQDADPAKISSITLVTAAVVADYLNSINLPLKVKWPNDLLAGGKKAGGILTEFKGEPDRTEYLLIGIGLNVHHQADDFPDELKSLATSLSLEGNTDIKRSELLLAILDMLQQAYELYFTSGLAPFLALWKKHNVTLGRQVKVRLPGGSTEGKAIDLDEKGALILQGESGDIHAISYGEIV